MNWFWMSSWWVQLPISPELLNYIKIRSRARKKLLVLSSLCLRVYSNELLWNESQFEPKLESFQTTRNWVPVSGNRIWSSDSVVSTWWWDLISVWISRTKMSLNFEVQCLWRLTTAKSWYFCTSFCSCFT